MQPEQIIEKLGLIPLEPEGGMYSRTYTTQETVNGRPMGSAIYYMLRGNAYSHLHMLDADEVYHFYIGDPVELTQIDGQGNCFKTILGSDIENGQQVQCVVPKNVWQGLRLVKGGEFALMGTTMSPGYTDNFYIHADPEEIKERYPLLTDTIKNLTCKDIGEDL